MILQPYREAEERRKEGTKIKNGKSSTLMRLRKMSIIANFIGEELYPSV